MKRWLLCLTLLALYTGCGSSNPVTPAPEPPAGNTYDHVTVDEADAYIADIHRAFLSIDVFLAEYGGVTAEVTYNLIPIYWSRQFIDTMIARIHAIQATLHGMRPQIRICSDCTSRNLKPPSQIISMEPLFYSKISIL